MSEYFIPSGLGESEYIEKKSRFIGHVMPVSSEEEAKNYIAEMKKRYYDARHNCWCYIIRNGAVRYSDDSEPQGTAGIPMLEVLKKAEVENVVCVVTRYFGGVLLGTGGLLRAYTKAAKDALESAGLSSVSLWSEIIIEIAYNQLERTKNAIDDFNGVLEETNYSDTVKLTVLMRQEQSERFVEAITDLTSGVAKCTISGESFRPVKIN